MRKIFIVLAAIIIVSLIPFFIDYMLYDVKDLQTSVGVGGYLGFNIDTDKLYFGTLIQDGSATRDFYVENYVCDKCLVEIKPYGPISKIISLSNYRFLMKKGEKKASQTIRPDSHQRIRRIKIINKIFIFDHG